MENEHLQDDNIFRYQTESGFTAETFNQVLPAYNIQAKSLGWHDFVQLQFDDFYGEPNLQALVFDQIPDAVIDGQHIYAAPSAQTWEFNQLFETVADGQHRCYVVQSSFHVAAIVERQVQHVLQCLGRFVIRIVGHISLSVPLMAGAEYLVSREEQVRTQASAKDHIVHLELLNLSREHSDLSLFSIELRKLKRPGWRRCLVLCGSFGSYLKVWMPFTLFGGVSHSFGTASMT